MGPDSGLQRALLVVGLLTLVVGGWGLYASWEAHASVAGLIEQSRADFVPRSWTLDACEREPIPLLLRASPEELLPAEGIGVWGLADPCTMVTDAWRTAVGLGAWFLTAVFAGLASLGFVLTPLRSRAWAPFGLAALTLGLAGFAGRALAVLVVLSKRVLTAAMVLPLPNQAPPSWWTLLRQEPALLLSVVGLCACVLLGIACGVELVPRARS